jgi:dolichol kinase
MSQHDKISLSGQEDLDNSAISSNTSALRTSRSPHPYQRSQRQNLDRRPAPARLLETDSLANGSFASEATTNNFGSRDDPVDRISDDDVYGHSRHLDVSNSTSGSEADDEGLRLLKSLPAPPLLRRKGLKGALDLDVLEAPSPPFTPFPFELSTDGQLVESPVEPDELKQQVVLVATTTQLSPKDQSKRRGEFIRRAVELALVAGICLLTLSGQDAFATAQEWKLELFTAFATLALLGLLYPVRLYRKYLQLVKEHNLVRNWKWFRIRSTFDPAPLIYPILIPLLISLSLGRGNSHTLLPNLVLSLSTLPPELVPFSEATECYSTFHWLLATLPLFLSKKLTMAYDERISLYTFQLSPADLVSAEILVLLYPLHLSVVSMLRSFTKASLLAAEVQLLSVTLVNILIHSTLPQFVILKCLLWYIGGGIALLCQAPLEWGVILARIPKWRLRRTRKVIKHRNGVLEILSGALDWGKKESLSLLGQESETSSNDEEQPDQIRKKDKRRSLHIDRPTDKASDMSSLVNSFSTEERSESLPVGVRHRSLAASTALNTWLRSKKIARDKLQRWRSPGMQFYLSLTPQQATTRKWVYAGYVYAVTVFLILIPGRMYIGHKALDGHEPVGWALGYLFGNIQSFRWWSVNNGLERWMCLPPRPRLQTLSSFAFQTLFQKPDPDFSVDNYRLNIIGEANTRLLMCAYYLLILVVGLLTVFALSTKVEVDTRRKVFHGMMVAMFHPTIYTDPSFISLAFGLILAIFLLLDLFRAAQVPPISKPLARFLTPYVDGRDLRGPVVVSHVFLLIGCAIPLWFSMSALSTPLAVASNMSSSNEANCFSKWNIAEREVAMVSGVICVGLGDAAASLIGRRYGRTKWVWSGGKSLNGSLAFAVAVTVGLVTAKLWLFAGGWVDGAGSEAQLWVVILKAAIVGTGGSLIEATLTGCNDNVVVPVFLWLLVRGLKL